MRPSEALERHREEVASILFRYPVSNPRVFGSVARGEDTEESDLDIIVKGGEGLSYAEIFRLEDDLTALMGIKVDVRTEGEFRAPTLGRISRDFKPI